MCKKIFVNVLEFILLVLGIPVAMVMVCIPILPVIMKLISLNSPALPVVLIFILILDCGVAGGILVEKAEKTSK